MGSSLVLNRRPKVPAEDSAAFGAIAERFRRAGALDQAVSLCRDGLKKFPDHVSARVTLGWSLLDLRKYDEARLELEQVMRRAPDNLAAIRGLAELHDRFEQTLHLPMDGPGQWPPPADSVDVEVAPAGDDALMFETGATVLSEAFDTEPAIYDPPVAAIPNMTPPEMGLPLWTPEPVAPALAEAVANTQIHAPMPGRSSVREIDSFAGAPEAFAPVPIPEPVQAADVIGAPTMAVADLGVTDETLAALIAEADALDAVAALEEVATTPSLELPNLELATAEFELAMPTAQEIETAQFESVVAEAAAEVPEELPLLDLFAMTAEPMLAVEEMVDAAPVAVEATVVVAAPSVVEATALAEPMIEPEVVAQAADVLAFVRPPEEEASRRKGERMLSALEGLLARVHSRRLQLMAESVA